MIGIFDSGIGGISVFKEILKELPNYQYLYYSDSKNIPYGDKDAATLNKITEEIVSYLLKEGASIIVIACNTASAICKDYLRAKFSIPIIAIEPAYKLINDKYKDSKTLILGTKATLNSAAFLKLYQEYDNHKTTILECPNLADLIEQDQKQEIITYLNTYLKKYQGIESVVLGCTHYPLIINELQKVLGNDVNFIHGGKGVAENLKRIVGKINLQPQKQKIIFFDSSKNTKKEERFWEILAKKE